MSNLSIPVKSSGSKLYFSEINQIVAAVNSKQDSLTIANNLTTTSTGSLLDASQAKALKDLIDQLTSLLNGKEPTVLAGTALQYYRGDKVFATLNQDVVPSGITNKVYTAVEQAKLASLVNYALPIASSSVLGGVKQGTNITISSDGTISSTATGGTSTTDASLLTTGTLSIARLPTLAVSNITNLQSLLDGKSNVGHSQPASSITGLATIATSGSYTDLLGKPVLFSGSYTDLTGKPTNVSSFTNDSGYQTAANVTTAIAGKQDTLISGTTIKTVNGTTLLGSGDLVISGGTGTSQPGLIVVTTLTSAGLQAAINSAVAGTTITWTGTINLTADIDIANKTNLYIEGYGQAKLTRSDSSNMIAIRGGIVNLKISGIEFVNTCATSNIAMILSTQQGTVDGLTIERCSFTNNSAAGTNALSINCVGGASSEFVVQYKNIFIKNNKFINIGRMAVEILNHAWDGSGPQLITENVIVNDNTFENLGTGNANGMAISISGLHRKVRVFKNVVKDAKLTSIEIIGGDDVIVDNNDIEDINNTTTAIVISDGYKNGTSGFVKNMIVSKNISNTKGRPLVLYYASRVTYVDNNAVSLINIDVKSSDCSIINNDILVTGAFNVLVLDGSNRNKIVGNTFSTYPNTQAGQTSSVIRIFNGSSTNYITANKLIRTSGAFNFHIEQPDITSNNTGASSDGLTNTQNQYITRT